MCTSFEFRSEDFYFARNMDIDFELFGRLIFTPKNFELKFKKMQSIKEHYAFLGVGTVYNGYALYADGVNEKGLCAAGLNFPQNAYYPSEISETKNNVSVFEFIPYVLSRFQSVKELKENFQNIHLVDIPLSSSVPITPLHWHIADENEGIVVESVKDGLFIYENVPAVMTNNPPFDFHLQNLFHYTNLSPKTAFDSSLHPFGLGLGAFGLPGDMSSTSRFVKTAFLLKYAEKSNSDEENTATAFNILSNVCVVKGTVKSEKGACHYTKYSAVINAKKGIYNLKKANSLSIQTVKLNDFDFYNKSLIQICLKDQLV